MKKWLSILVFIVLFSCSGEQQSSVDELKEQIMPSHELKEQIMAGHDVVMPKMNKVKQLEIAIKPCLIVLKLKMIPY